MTVQVLLATLAADLKDLIVSRFYYPISGVTCSSSHDI